MKRSDTERAECRAIQGAAATVVARAIRHKRLRRPAEFPCADCGNPADRYDHRDYTQPLKVEPVCRACNTRRGPALVWCASQAAPEPAKAAA